MRPISAQMRLCLVVVATLFLGDALASEVIVLTDANFDSLLRSRAGIWMIDIYSPGCASPPLMCDMQSSCMDMIH